MSEHSSKHAFEQRLGWAYCKHCLKLADDPIHAQAEPKLVEIAEKWPWDMPTRERRLYELIAAKAPEDRSIYEDLAKANIDRLLQSIEANDSLRKSLKDTERELSQAQQSIASLESELEAINGAHRQMAQMLASARRT